MGGCCIAKSIAVPRLGHLIAAAVLQHCLLATAYEKPSSSRGYEYIQIGNHNGCRTASVSGMAIVYCDYGCAVVTMLFFLPSRPYATNLWPRPVPLTFLSTCVSLTPAQAYLPPLLQSRNPPARFFSQHFISTPPISLQLAPATEP